MVLPSNDLGRRDYAEKRLNALEAIMSDPFQAMVEVYTEVVGEVENSSKRSSSGTRM